MDDKLIMITRCYRYGFITWCILATCTIIAHSTALYHLFHKRRKMVIDLLIMHLFCNQLVCIVWDSFNYKDIFSKRSNHSTDAEHLFGETITVVSLDQSILLIILDRLLAVKDPLFYGALATRKNMALSIVSVWGISVLHGIVIPFTPKRVTTWMMAVWNVITATMIGVSYYYIPLAICKAKFFSTRPSSQQILGQIKFEIPMGMAASFSLLFILPDMAVLYNPEWYGIGIWYVLAWYVNFNINPLIYIYSSRKEWERHCSCTRSPQIHHRSEEERMNNETAMV